MLSATLGSSVGTRRPWRITTGCEGWDILNFVLWLNSEGASPCFWLGLLDWCNGCRSSEHHSDTCTLAGHMCPLAVSPFKPVSEWNLKKNLTLFFLFNCIYSFSFVRFCQCTNVFKISQTTKACEQTAAGSQDCLAWHSPSWAVLAGLGLRNKLSF